MLLQAVLAAEVVVIAAETAPGDVPYADFIQFGILGIIFFMVVFRKGMCLCREVDDRDKIIAAKDAEIGLKNELVGKYQEKWEQAIPLLARAIEIIEKNARPKRTAR